MDKDNNNSTYPYWFRSVEESSSLGNTNTSIEAQRIASFEEALRTPVPYSSWSSSSESDSDIEEPLDAEEITAEAEDVTTEISDLNLDEKTSESTSNDAMEGYQEARRCKAFEFLYSLVTGEPMILKNMSPDSRKMIEEIVFKVTSTENGFCACPKHLLIMRMMNDPGVSNELLESVSPDSREQILMQMSAHNERGSKFER